jgi:hypothetical protein
MIQQDLVELGKMPFVPFMPFGTVGKIHISNDSNDMKGILHTFTRRRGIEK